nr:MAG TPA: hypothetical protein [Caudoviricetes sp.]
MKYLVLDGYLKYHDEGCGRLRCVDRDIYCALFGQVYKLEEDCDITYITRKDGEFTLETKSFNSGTIVLITQNDDVIDITDTNKLVAHITDEVNIRLQRLKKSEQSAVVCGDACAG